MIALGAVRALTSRGLKVPEDVSVVGFDDEEIAQITEPSFTTVRMPTEDIGAKCVNMLNDITNSGVLRQEPVFLPVELILRESTAPPKELTK
jgi:DNA-binding LacI/PurR family transcriptional regulator